MKKRSMVALSAGALVAAMLPGLTVAQEAPDSDDPVFFEWSVTPGEDGHGGTVEATDPRASGTLTIGTGEALVTDAVLLASFSLRLANDEGTWTGTGRAYGGGEDQDADWTIWELTGEGGYEDLSLFTFDTSATEGSVGMIVPTDVIPPYPELPTE